MIIKIVEPGGKKGNIVPTLKDQEPRKRETETARAGQGPSMGTEKGGATSA